MGTALASLTGYGRPINPPSNTGQVPTYNPDFTFEAFATAGDVASTGVPGGQTIVGGTVAGENLTLTPSSGGDGDIIVTGGGIILDNNEALQWRNTGGFLRPVVNLDDSNRVIFHAIDGGAGGGFRFNTSAGTSLTITSESVTFNDGNKDRPGVRFTDNVNNGLGFFKPAEDNIGLTINSREEFRFA